MKTEEIYFWLLQKKEFSFVIFTNEINIKEEDGKKILQFLEEKEFILRFAGGYSSLAVNADEQIDSYYPSENFLLFKHNFIEKYDKEFADVVKDVEKKPMLEKIYAQINLDQLKKDINMLIATNQRNEATELMAKTLLSLEHIYTIRQDNIDPEMWIYRDGIYINNAKTYIEEFCREILSFLYTSHIKNAVMAKIIVDTYVHLEDFFSIKDVNKIAVQNGILDLQTKMLEPFSPEFIFLNKINAHFNPGNECEKIKEFMKQILNEEDIPCIQELFGYLLLRDYRIPKAFMLMGSGRNGKGRLTELIKIFLGVENCTNLPLEVLENDDFALAELFNKLANISADISPTALKNTGNFKSATGQDMLSANRKFKSRIKFVNHAKFIYCANQIPLTKDLTEAFWSRWEMINFPYTFYTEEEIAKLKEQQEDVSHLKIADRTIMQKLTSPQEMSGLLNWALEGLHRLLKQSNFTGSKTTKEIKALWIKKSDSFRSFIEEFVEQDSNSFTPKINLKEAYLDYCTRQKLMPCSEKRIKETLMETYSSYEDQKTIFLNNKEIRMRGWMYIRLKSPYEMKDIVIL